MAEIKRSWLAGMVGGIVGLIAIALPWAALHLSAAGQTYSKNVTIWDLMDLNSALASLNGSASVAVIQDMLTALQVGIAVVVIGAAIYVAGCVLSMARPVGGIVMLVGSVISGAGTFVASTTKSYMFVSISIGLWPSIGIVLALAASFIAIIGYAMQRGENAPRVVYVPVPQMPPPPWPDTSKPWPPQQSVSTNMPPPPPATATEAVPAAYRAFCPLCGRRYVSMEDPSRFCPKDGTELRAID